MGQPLEEVITGHRGVLVLLFTGGGGPEEEAARRAARELVAQAPAGDRALFMEVGLGSWTEVAARHGVHGAPAILVFRDGARLARCLGRTCLATLRDLLHRGS